MSLSDSRSLRICAGIVAGAITWHVVLGASMGLLRLLWPAYDAAYPDRDYTLLMLWVRLVVFSGTVIVTGVAAARIGRDQRLAWLAGLVILGFSIPPHLYPGTIWDEYPPWYHLTWLLSILPLAIASGRISRRWEGRVPSPATA